MAVPATTGAITSLAVYPNRVLRVSFELVPYRDQDSEAFLQDYIGDYIAKLLREDGIGLASKLDIQPKERA